jgi:hypothetical protein
MEKHKMNKLILVHEWIGPTGPVSNTRMPNLADFYHRTTGTQMFPQGLEPFYYFIKNNIDVVLKTPCMLKENEKFIYELDMSHKRDWHSNFLISRGLLENAKISDDVLEKVRNKIGFLLFTTPMESFLDDHMFELMHQYFEVHSIPLTQVIYATNSPNGKDIYKKFCNQRDIEPQINCEYIGMYERLLISETRDSESLLKNTYTPGAKKKTFLNFNRRYRQQRFWFLLEIYKRGLLEDFYISFDKVEPEGTTSFLDMAKEINKTMYVNLSEEDLVELDEKLPLVLDTDDFSVFPMEKNYSDTLSFYNDSLIHIATETFFFSTVIHVSEKTFKPIMFRQPFIFVGPPHMLKFLRTAGFKTFSEFWDESYDDIENHHERMATILSLIQKLANMTEEEKIELSNKVKDIVEYNFNQFINKPPTMLYDFIKKYGIE